jgi:hypothetical protein
MIYRSDGGDDTALGKSKLPGRPRGVFQNATGRPDPASFHMKSEHGDAGSDQGFRDVIDRIAKGVRRLGVFEAPDDGGAVLRLCRR